MTRLFLSLLLASLIGGCASFQPVTDNAERVSLALPSDSADSVRYAAPIFSVSLPSYLNQSTVWYSDSSGRLTSLPNFVWAEPLSKAIRRELALALARSKPFPEDSRIAIAFAPFILLSDGSGLSIAEAQASSPGSGKTLPILRSSLPNLWNPDDPSTFLEGYRKLLQSTVKQLSESLTDHPVFTHPKPPPSRETNP